MATQPKAPARAAKGSTATVPIGPRTAETARPISSAITTFPPTSRGRDGIQPSGPPATRLLRK
jgi:hypothetical protein